MTDENKIDDRLVHLEVLEQKESQDLNLRPKQLKEFIGQPQVQKNLSTFISAAVKRHEAMDHALLFGPPGLGKTTLAQIISFELGVGFRSTSGPIINKAGCNLSFAGLKTAVLRESKNINNDTKLKYKDNQRKMGAHGPPWDSRICRRAPDCLQ